MPAKLHADAGRFDRRRRQRDQSKCQEETSGGRETTVHESPLHDFVLVPVGVSFGETGSTHRKGSRSAKPAISGIEPEPVALLWWLLPSEPAADPTKY
jgi:hypothetical protein